MRFFLKTKMTIRIALRRLRNPTSMVIWAKTNRRMLTSALLIIFGTYLLWGEHLNFAAVSVSLPNSVDISNYQLLQPDVFEDFSTVEDGTPKIPHIIHQTAASSCISQMNVDYIKSFVRLNPDWDYYFWSDETGRMLIEYRHPYLLDLWDSLTEGIKRSDILRYVVLYEYGGVYADVDVENLRPLDRVTRKYYCIIPTEPLEHSAFLYSQPFIINNGIMLCSKKHPFFKQLLENLVYKINSNVMSATGPFYITNQFMTYNKNMHNNERSGTPEAFTAVLGSGAYEETEKEAVYVPNTHYFTDNIDVRSTGRMFREKCQLFWYQDILQQRACIDLAHKGLYRTNTKFVYTSHHWHHSWCSSIMVKLFRVLTHSCVDINYIVPNRKHINLEHLDKK